LVSGKQTRWLSWAQPSALAVLIRGKEKPMSQILQAIQDALSEVLEERVTELSLATDLQLHLDLDSIRFVQFLLTLEDKVPGLLFNPDTLNQSSFNRVETLVDYIENYRTAG
jgi:acyl carrier protein